METFLGRTLQAKDFKTISIRKNFEQPHAKRHNRRHPQMGSVYKEEFVYYGTEIFEFPEELIDDGTEVYWGFSSQAKSKIQFVMIEYAEDKIISISSVDPVLRLTLSSSFRELSSRNNYIRVLSGFLGETAEVRQDDSTELYLEIKFLKSSGFSRFIQYYNGQKDHIRRLDIMDNFKIYI
ncbi:MAG: hypothetical protein KDD38_03870 [Bdellovibrionales bacterium]|nr:hypothetical protein [Bdellovibrionales bacterium]